MAVWAAADIAPVTAGAGLSCRPDTTKTTGPLLVHFCGMAGSARGGGEP